MKKILSVALISLSFGTAFADEFRWNSPQGGSENSNIHIYKLDQAQKVAEYNGALTGYAKICGALEMDIKKIEGVVFGNFKVIGLNDIEISNLDATYKQSQSNTMAKNTTVTPVECKLFMAEFNKIINAINNPTPSSPPNPR